MRMIPLLKEGEPMPKTILLDELHLTVITPAGQSEPDYQAILRTLRSKPAFTQNLRAARSARYFKPAPVSQENSLPHRLLMPDA